MPTHRLFRAALPLALLTGVLVPLTAGHAAPRSTGPGDATVIAVLDSGFSPYHWDYLASQMPQALNRDRSDDLPLTKDPATWIKGFPKRSSFKSYQPLKLTLDNKHDDTTLDSLHAKDAKKWAGVKPSGPSGLNYYWIPGTKVIGSMAFGPEFPVDQAAYTLGGELHKRGVDDPVGNLGVFNPIYGSGGPEHGMGTASVSAGNIHGTCPECLLVFLQFTDDASGNRAIEWAMKQPWIDAISNSYGFHTAGSATTRDNVYGGADTALQRKVSERGQTIFWSAGNGYENAYVTPNQTLLSSQKGPDWIVTVGASTPQGANPTGAGKPVDLNGIGDSYPSAYDSNTVTNGGKFSGTSNATPTIAGTYARALYLVRRAMPGASKVQANGVIARGRIRCGRRLPSCELRDGVLTAKELRARLMNSAVSTGKGFAPGGVSDTGRVADTYFAAEGHGTYKAKWRADDDLWLEEFDRLRLPLFGLGAAPKRPAGEKAWFVVDSWCRQHIWGSWRQGDYKSGGKLPELDPQAWPTRAAYQTSCNALVAPPKRPVAS